MPKSYGIATAMDGDVAATWARAVEQIANAHNYWISTTRPDGRPHAMPVWGVWVDGALLFGTDRTSRKGRNIAANAAIVAHLESGDDVVVLEGVAEEVADAALLARYVEAYDAKYQFRLDTSDAATVTYALRPRVAFTWLERDFTGSALRWRLG
jgi:hypothetical protein